MPRLSEPWPLSSPHAGSSIFGPIRPCIGAEVTDARTSQTRSDRRHGDVVGERVHVDHAVVIAPARQGGGTSPIRSASPTRQMTGGRRSLPPAPYPLQRTLTHHNLATGAHPVVATHPETGRKLVYVNHSYTYGFEDLTEEESKPLLNYLLDHGHRPCRFRWETSSIAFWDDRCCKHLAIHDAGPFRSVMRRTQICGGRISDSTAAYWEDDRVSTSPGDTGQKKWLC